MSLKNIPVSLCLAFSLAFSSIVMAEDESVSSKAERLASKPTEGAPADLNVITRRAKLTEDQAVQQLKYMTVQAWKRIEAELKDKGSFQAFGLTLSPTGEFKPVFIAYQGNMPNEIQMDALVRNMKAIADTRSVWAVGIMYVTGFEQEDGSWAKRIGVVAEHIAGWAKAWSYPYKVDESGELRIGNSRMVDMDPVYFTRPQ